MVTYEDLVEAYLDCRVHKSRTNNCIKFTLDVEGNLYDMMQAINNRTYRPRRSICFVVSRPKYREVFAADFADRIIHHYIRLRLEPLIEQEFNDRTFNCRDGKGTLAGVDQLKKDIIECSNNYTKDCYVATVDINSFFMSILKKLVEDLVIRLIDEKYTGDDKDDLRFLCHVVLSHCTEENCIRQSSITMWNHLPASKSLFTNGEGLGMPIGNLPSQMFANYLLNSLDWAIEKEFGIKYHGRYVDDIYLISETPEAILNAIPKIRIKLESLGLKLSPKKFYMQHYTKGLDFTGAVVKPGRIYPLNRTVTNFRHSIHRLNQCKTKSQIIRALSSVNSYLGLLRHYDTYAIRYNGLMEIDIRLFKWLYIQGSMEIVKLKKRYHPRNRIRYRLYHNYQTQLSLPKPIARFEERDDKAKYIRMLSEYTPVEIPPISILESHKDY
ncbi:RNA-directed DNA polymerase [Prevotella sp. MGM2]|uniref:RNA-directed DNA polymerase n=1 Tax=Prevotella sp. MGM2 TaxID=2033406 RepID=UPI000CE9F7A1|nr:RNA-directed DNA polymerase [Prevotella sp. MGM2]GAY30676.1 Retron-type reverse transcriptase [Prevotella sp. MGM2]